MNLAEVLQRQALANPGRAAIIESRAGHDRVTTYADLEAASARGAALLASAGLGPGDGVLILQPMSAELYALLGAIFRLGLIAMFLDPSAGRAHIERCCELRSPRCVVTSPRAYLLAMTSTRLRAVPHKFVIGRRLPGARTWLDGTGSAAVTQIMDCAPEQPALLTFTSGSTGQPKAAVRSHGFLLAQYEVLQDYLDLRPGDVDLATLPIFALANLGAGVTTVVPQGDLRSPAAIDPGPIVDQIVRLRVSRMVTSPSVAERVATHCRDRGHTLRGLTRICTGGGPVFPRLLDLLREVAPQARVAALYGSTEAEPIADLDWADITDEDRAEMRRGRGLLAGKAVPRVRLEVIEDSWGRPIGPFSARSFESSCLPSGEAGEIVVSGEHVLKGYLDGRGDLETKFRVDDCVWHRTGDAGFRDEQGRIWLLGRCSAAIHDDRGRLYPFSLECALSHEPSVRRSAVTAVDGRRVLAIEPAEAIETAHLRRALDWAQLDDVVVVRRIPVDRRHNSKVDYPALERLLRSRARSRP